METTEKNQEFYDKEFKCNDSTVCRSDLESFPIPFCTENVSDETMQKVVDDTDAGIRQRWKIRDDKPLDMENEDISETWWEELEEAANHYNIKYYDDLKTE